MNNEIAWQKAELRRAVRAVRAAFPPQQRTAESAVIAQKLERLPEVIRAHTVHIYLAMPTEVDTVAVIRRLCAAEKRVVVPWMTDEGTMRASELHLDDLDLLTTTGKLHVPQPPVYRPVQDGDWQVVIVPLVAATLAGKRLGNGAGHYDRLLSRWPRPAIGVALSCQIVQSVPLEDHDIDLAMLVHA